MKEREKGYEWAGDAGREDERCIEKKSAGREKSGKKKKKKPMAL